jgi:hypothetical protein
LLQRGRELRRILPCRQSAAFFLRGSNRVEDRLHVFLLLDRAFAGDERAVIETDGLIERQSDGVACLLRLALELVEVGDHLHQSGDERDEHRAFERSGERAGDAGIFARIFSRPAGICTPSVFESSMPASRASFCCFAMPVKTTLPRCPTFCSPPVMLFTPCTTPLSSSVTSIWTDVATKRSSAICFLSPAS